MLESDNKIMRELFEEKLERIHDAINSLTASSSAMDEKILEQATRTNGRVNKLEERMEKVEGDTALISTLAKNKSFILILIAVLSGTSLSQVLPLILGQ